MLMPSDACGKEYYHQAMLMLSNTDAKQCYANASAA